MTTGARIDECSGVTEQLMAGGSLAGAHPDVTAYYTLVADMSETNNTWWKDSEMLFVTGATNACAEAANTAIKQLRRTGRAKAALSPTKPVSSLAVH